MIDYDITFNETGISKEYFDKFPFSKKIVYTICDNCKNSRWIKKDNYKPLCRSCSHKKSWLNNNKRLDDMSKRMMGHEVSEKTRKLIGDGHKGNKHTDDAKQKISKSHKGKKLLATHKQAISEGNKGKFISLEQKINHSCIMQGINRSEWCGFATEQKYCTKFNESCREHNREKYDRLCFICNKSENDNGRKLSVHHVDMNKQQGCDSDWKLVPVCSQCHNKLHTKLWEMRIKYLIGD